MPHIPRKILLAFLFLVLAPTALVSSRTQINVPFAEKMDFPSRQVAQLSQGVYDPISNRTFMTYPGCREPSAAICAVDPYITYYAHGTATWATPLNIPNARPPEYDAHTYPQIVIDSQDYIHVFNGDHLDPIRHYRSTIKASDPHILAPGNWQEQPFSNTSDQDKATYLLVFKTHNNALYLFYRQSIPGVGCQTTCWYEPIYFIKSVDDGQTWSIPRKVIDPGGKNRSDGSCDNLINDDTWDTIYIKGLHYQSDPERLHIAFENHKDHNLYEDKLFYVTFNFSDEKVYAPTGGDLGQCVNQYEFENPANKTEIYSSGVKEFSDTMSVIGIDVTGNVNILHTTTTSQGQVVVDQLVWNGSDWNPPIHLFWNEPYDTRPHDIQFYPDNSFDLFGEQRTSNLSLIQLERWHYNNNAANPQCLKTTIISSTDSLARHDFAFLTNPHPDVKATFIEGQFIDWQNPPATGKMYPWGKREDSWLSSINGHIADVAGQEFPGVSISSGAGLTTASDATGHYTFTDAPGGTWTLTPTLASYIFYPPTRTVTLPPHAVGQNFVILASPVSITLSLGNDAVSLPANLIYTDTQNLTTRLDFPSGAITQPLTLTLQPTVATMDAAAVFAGHAFELAAEQQNIVQPELQFGAPVTVTIHYSDNDLRVISDESRLSLRWWTGDKWHDASKTCGTSSVYVRDPASHTLSVAVCRTGYFGLFGPTNQTFLPLTLYTAEAGRLTSHSANDSQPALAPDEKSIAFISDREGRPDVYRASTMGGPATNLTQTSCADEDTPTFSPDGSKILFASNRAGDWNIYSMDADGSNVRLVVGEAGTDEVQPSFAPDGSSIIFSSNRANGNWDIYTATLSGGNWTRLTNDPAADRFPSFSKDGDTVVFRSERDGNSEIYLMNADGSNQRRITNDPTYDGYPTLIPDGSGIVFVSTRSGKRALYQVNLAGDGLKALEQRSGWEMDTPRVSPSGRSLVYAGGPTGQSFDIYQREFVSPLMAIGQQGAVNLAQGCEWDAGVLAYGWLHAWQRTGDQRYYQWARQWIDACIKVKPNITHVNDGLLGYAALIAYQVDGGPERLAYAQRVADYLINAAPRTADGTLVHDANRVWADTLLGTIPFLVKMSQVSGNNSYTEEAVAQVLKHAEHLQDPSSGLYHHAWDASHSDLSGQAYWGRGNGWALLADTAVLSTITTTHPARSTILDIMQKQAAGLKSLQTSTGQWHTVTTRSDFYLETSASALIGYALRQGIEEGWLDKNTYSVAAQAALSGVWHQVLADGTVTNVSGPTWPMQETEYNTISRSALQLYGQGTALLVASPAKP